MRNQKPFTKQRIFDKAPGESVNPLKRVKSLIEKNLRGHLGNGWSYVNQVKNGQELLNSIYSTVQLVEGRTFAQGYFYFGDPTGKNLNVNSKAADDFINKLPVGQEFRIYACTNEVVNSRTGKKTLEKIHVIVNVLKSDTNTFKVSSYWDITQSPEKFDVTVATNYIKQIFIPNHSSQLEQQEMKLVNDTMRFWHTL